MSITGKIKTLFADSAKTEALFPRTKVSAVSDDNGVGLDALLGAKANTAHTHTAAEVGAATESYVDTKLASFSSCPFAVGTSAPSNKNLLWIDTTATTGGLKYYNGSSWVHVPVAYT